MKSEHRLDVAKDGVSLVRDCSVEDLRDFFNKLLLTEQTRWTTVEAQGVIMQIASVVLVEALLSNRKNWQV
jgi:hypothetical protein